MPLFKCKMCGGSLDITTGVSVIECEYCGTQQTLPKLNDDKRANMYDRANHFRRNNEFDKAMGIYEQILTEDNTDAEAYWSLVLCRFGIEYVEDPASHKRIPTVNRAQFTSVFDDDNYKSALQYADIYQRVIYEVEAKTINEIQKGILAISQKEEPFDVFICYKESDNGGRRTPDSVLAQDLYYQLTQEGFKVFFARITLEDKLGSAYEPYIFAALNSAKVMVALGTKPEYFQAAWVKNEWSRYLALIKQGKKKMLIPAYKDMDAYDLPEEFSHLQAQDMSKLGFMQDLIRGIEKIIEKPGINNRLNSTSYIDHDKKNALLKRISIFLRDQDWENANAYCEKVLDMDPENGTAYFYKLLAQGKVSSLDELRRNALPLDQMSAYRNAVYYADEQTAQQLKEYNQIIKKRIAEAEAYRIEQERIQAENAKIKNEKRKALNQKLEDKREQSSRLGSQLQKELEILQSVYKNRKDLEKTITTKRIVQNQMTEHYEKKAKRVRTCLILLIVSLLAGVVIALSALADSSEESITTRLIFIYVCAIFYLIFGGMLASACEKSAGLTFWNLITYGLFSLIFAAVMISRNRKEREDETFRAWTEINNAKSQLTKVEEEITRRQRSVSILQNQCKELGAEIKELEANLSNITKKQK